MIASNACKDPESGDVMNPDAWLLAGAVNNELENIMLHMSKTCNNQDPTPQKTISWTRLWYWIQGQTALAGW